MTATYGSSPIQFFDKTGDYLVKGVRKVLLPILRFSRRLLPYPKLWASLFGKQVPKNCIAGKASRLFRPESVVFSPSGDLMVVSNSGKHAVNIYTKGPQASGAFSVRPNCVVSDKALLSYAHDSAFSPCGKFLAVVGEYSHTLSMLAVYREGETKIRTEALWSIQGDEHGLSYPASVAIDPSGQWLAVANRRKHGITLYRSTGVGGQFVPTPCQSITDEELAQHGLAAPHGVDFSPDGKFLAATHKGFKQYQLDNDSGVSIFKLQPEADAGLDPMPEFIHPYGSASLHLPAFHPSGSCLAVSRSDGGIDTFEWSSAEKKLIQRDSISIFRVREGAKGMAFATGGSQVVTTTDLHEVLFFDFAA